MINGSKQQVLNKLPHIKDKALDAKKLLEFKEEVESIRMRVI